MKIKSHLIIALSGVFLLCQSCKGATDSNIPSLLTGIQTYISDIEKDFNQIPEERKIELRKIALYIQNQNSKNEVIKLNFICTHNSRRSHMGQVWAQTAAYFYNIKNVSCYSGGTEATAFNPRAVKALRKAGFEINQTDTTTNPVFLISYSKEAAPIKGFSKKYDDAFNPQENFVAIMTCSQADQTCPFVSGSALRVSIPYDDPKIADNTPEEEAKYDERCKQIATEMFYLFSLVNSN